MDDELFSGLSESDPGGIGRRVAQAMFGLPDSAFERTLGRFSDEINPIEPRARKFLDDLIGAATAEWKRFKARAPQGGLH